MRADHSPGTRAARVPRRDGDCDWKTENSQILLEVESIALLVVFADLSRAHERQRVDEQVGWVTGNS